MSPSRLHPGPGSPHRSVGLRWGSEGSRGSAGFPLSDGKRRSVGHSAVLRRSLWLNMVTIVTLKHMNMSLCVIQCSDGQSGTQSRTELAAE